jgi:Zn-dependent protease
MHEHASWSISLGRWCGLQVRLHMFFLLFAALAFCLSWQNRAGRDAVGGDWLAGQALAVLLASVLVHEVGHVWTALRLGGEADQMVLGPLGGLVTPARVAEPRAEILVHLAGPLTNLALCLVSAAAVAAKSGPVVGLLNPLSPEGLTEGGTGVVLWKLCCWVNWVLFLANLLPAFPFDGGRALRALVLAYWPTLGVRGAVLVVAAVAKAAAVAMFIMSLVVRAEPAPGLMPMRFALILLAILLFFSAKREEHSQQAAEPASPEVEYEEADDTDDGLHPDRFDGAEAAPGPWRRWLEQRRLGRQRQQSEIEAEEERRVDEILARLHEHGLSSLSAEDRSLLERVSRRYRSRLKR